MSGKLCIIFAYFTITAFAAVWQGEQDEKPGFEGLCYFTHEGNQTTFFPPGTDGYDVDGCAKYECGGTVSPGKLYISGMSCGVVGAGPGCKVTGIRKGRKYPGCCPDVDCSSEESNEKIVQASTSPRTLTGNEIGGETKNTVETKV